MLFIRNFITVIAATLLLSASTYANETKTIYIEIVGEGKFDVLYHRVLSTSTGAVIGGLIGAGIQSGIEAGRDQKKTKELSPLIVKDTWKTRFLDTLNDKLESRGFEAVWVEDSKDIDNGLVLRIYPDRYGFKLVNSTTLLVSAFIDFKVSFSSRSSKKTKEQEKEAYYLTNKNQYSFDDLLKEGSPVNADLEAVLEKAAKRLANKIIYSVKE
jgi:hypothetical protein